MVGGEGLEARSPEWLLCNKGSSRELGVTLTAMLCSEAGDERVSEQGRSVRARARRLPGRARPPARRRRARPYANEPGAGREEGPDSAPGRELDPGGRPA